LLTWLPTTSVTPLLPSTLLSLPLILPWDPWVGQVVAKRPRIRCWSRGTRDKSKRDDLSHLLEFQTPILFCQHLRERNNIYKNTYKNTYKNKLIPVNTRDTAVRVRCAAVCQNPKPYPYLCYPFWKHCGYSRTRAEPYWPHIDKNYEYSTEGRLQHNIESYKHNQNA